MISTSSPTTSSSMQVSLETLQNFCEATEQNPWMRSPFSLKRFTYAGGRSIVLRVARRDDVADIGRGRKVESFFKYNFPRVRVKFVPLPALPKRSRKNATVQIGEWFCNVETFRLVSALPNVKIGLPRDKDELPAGLRLIGFSFGGGVGWSAEGIGMIMAWFPGKETAK